MLRHSRASLIFILLATGMSLHSFASEPVPKIEIPELGPKKIPQDILRCERLYQYQRKTLPCDSSVATDGEGLRALLESVPAARQELELYQSNRSRLDITAYTGMAGLLITAIGPRLFADRTGKNASIGLGISIVLGSFAFGKSRLALNEEHLDRAIHHFNAVHPDDPIIRLRSEIAHSTESLGRP